MRIVQAWHWVSSRGSTSDSPSYYCIVTTLHLGQRSYISLAFFPLAMDSHYHFKPRYFGIFPVSLGLMHPHKVWVKLKNPSQRYSLPPRCIGTWTHWSHLCLQAIKTLQALIHFGPIQFYLAVSIQKRPDFSCTEKIVGKFWKEKRLSIFIKGLICPKYSVAIMWMYVFMLF